MLFLCWMDVRDFEILSDVIKGPMHENSRRVSSVVRVDVSGPYLQGVNIGVNFCNLSAPKIIRWVHHRPTCNHIKTKYFFYTVLQIPFSSLLRLKFILSPTFFDIQFLNWFFSLKFFHLFLFTQLSSPLGLDPQPCPLVWVLIAWVETHSLLTDKSIQTGSLWSLWWLKGIQSKFTYRTTLECFRILLKAF